VNELGREKLVAAALKGVKQIKGDYYRDGGFCAMGVLGVDNPNDARDEFAVCDEYGIDYRAVGRVCEVCQERVGTELCLIIHLNDYHDMDFLTIARKVGTNE
jgi:hypothetical protein